jgi:hypothetical protein
MMPISPADRIAIHEVISLHGHIADDGTTDELPRLLTHDAIYDVEAFGLGIVHGLPAIRDLFEARPGEQPIGHHVTNIVVSEGTDGTVRVRSKGLAVMPGGRVGSVVYDDIVVNTPEGWRIAQRKILVRR